MKFKYTARDGMGEAQEGKISAESREEATQLLEADGLRVEEIEENFESGIFARGIKKNEIIYLTSQLAIMVDTGITLSTALNGIAEQTDNPTLRNMLMDLRNQVEGGEDFSVALAKYPKYFDRTFVALIRASEQTGTLGSMLDRISGFLRSQLETGSKVRAAMAYPGVMMCIAIAVTTFLLTVILPKFTPIFEKQGAALPVPTKIILVVSHVMIDYWYLWLLGIGSAVGGFLYGRNTTFGRMTLDGLRIHLPLFGPMFRKATLSRSLSTLATMLQSGVTVLDSIRLCAEVAGNYWYEQAWLHVVEKITEGDRIAESLKGNKLFPKTLLQMISSGEETGRLDYVLEKVSTYYDREVETSIKGLTSMIEPLLITVMGAVVGTIGMGIMLPIFQLSKGH
jgi:type IV pilus assembly protein PilC